MCVNVCVNVQHWCYQSDFGCGIWWILTILSPVTMLIIIIIIDNRWRFYDDNNLQQHEENDENSLFTQELNWKKNDKWHYHGTKIFKKLFVYMPLVVVYGILLISNE